jgi:hypothetical protein
MQMIDPMSEKGHRIVPDFLCTQPLYYHLNQNKNLVFVFIVMWAIFQLSSGIILYNNRHIFQNRDSNYYLEHIYIFPVYNAVYNS